MGARAFCPPPFIVLSNHRYGAGTQVYEELKQVRNCHSAFKYGLLPGLAFSGAAAWVLRGMEGKLFSNTKTDAEKTKPAAECEPITYPKPDGVISFDLLTNLQRSNTNHEHDQPSHLRMRNDDLADFPAEVSLP